MPRPRVAVTTRLDERLLSALAAAADVRTHESSEPPGTRQLLELLDGCDAVVCLLTDRITAEVLAACPELKLIANIAVGYDNIDIDEANAKNVLVTNTPGVLDETTADLAFALMLALARRIPEADRFVRAGRWQRWTVDLMLGTDIHGKTLGLIGFGRIGRAVAARAAGFGMKVLYARSRPPAPGKAASGQPYPRHVALDELLASSDFISVHCPLTAATYQLIGRRELGLVKPECILVNTSRGAVVDEEALIEALRKGRLKGAGLDVFANEPEVPAELLTMDNVVLTPHIGSASVETRFAMAELAVNGLIEAFAGRKPANVVNRQVWESFLAHTKSKFG